MGGGASAPLSLRLRGFQPRPHRSLGAPKLTTFANPRTLTPELENAVKAKVASGLYNNASEVIREALRQSLLREQDSQWIAREAAIGFLQLQADPTVQVKSQDHFNDLVRGQA